MATIVDAGPNFLSWLQGEGFCADPTSCIASAIFQVLWKLLGLPDPLAFFASLFDSIFGGRPKLGPDSATDNVALTLLASRNPYVRAWGRGVRLLERRGIPISISDVAAWRRTYGALQTAIARDLEMQMPQATPNGKSAGARTFTAFQNLAYSRSCNQSSRDPECNREAFRIDSLWYIPLVVQAGGGSGRRCACAPPAR